MLKKSSKIAKNAKKSSEIAKNAQNRQKCLKYKIYGPRPRRWSANQSILFISLDMIII